ncbi:substrate-binding periplasmic protein [Streptomyces griseochromogenes]|uniref:substrate-binding periplasmic protein n=1 Tax=Streptomyces griseochromogenes TaxID=68214 RepID=UPI00379CA133
MSGSALDRGTLRIGFQRNTPPFSYSPTAEFHPIGYSVDLAQLVLAKVFRRVEIIPPVQAVEVTSSTREGLLVGGGIDMECGSTTITEERLLRNAFSRPIFRNSHRIAHRSGTNSPAPGGLRVVGIQGSTSEAALRSQSDIGFEYTFIGVPSIGAARNAFSNDQHVDAMVADEVILRSLLRGSAAAEDIRLMDVRLGEECYGFMMRHGDEALVHSVDAALDDVFASPDYLLLRKKWFHDELPGLGFGLEIDPADEMFVS